MAAAITGETRGPRAGTAALLGRVPVGRPNARVRLSSGTRHLELPVQDGHWGCFGLPAGRYRVEYVAQRLILARDVDVDEGREVEIDFDVL
jgi:hypothetical protein